MKNFIKWLLIVVFWGVIIVFISIYISSLSSYKESDFNIPKDFFNTKHFDKDENSIKNWFNDFVKLLNEFLWEKNKWFDLTYFDNKSRCIFDNKHSCKYLEKSDINKDDFYKFKSFILSQGKKFEKINNKEFIKQTNKYTWLSGKFIFYTWLIEYIRSSRYLVYYYFEKWKYNLWMNILLDNQKFLDNLINKSDLNLIWWLSLITMQKINLESINYIIKNYEIDNDLNNKINLVLEKEIDKWLIENGIKHEYFYFKEAIKISTLDTMQINIFYSENETFALLKKSFYDKIKKDNSFKVWFNLNNYIWRFLVYWNISADYNNQFKKEDDLHKLRKGILEKLNSN